ncbi:MAG: FAD-dependent oxidoreductase [Ilumatobacteraceae bacterium]
MSQLDRIVVVGASLAGLRACENLRTRGFEGEIVLVGGEAHRPYDRPPLSKKVLAGEWAGEQIELRKGEPFDQLDLDLRLGVRATALDPQTRTLTLADGETLTYDGLILAVGATCRRLPGQEEIEGVHELRTLDDSLALRDRLADGTARVVVIGAGFIGLEVAATARSKGCDVTVLEGAEAPMMRGLGAEMGAKAATVHRDRGVDVRCSVTVAGLLTEDGRVTGVELGDGSVVPADVVVVGIGVSPDTQWLEGSGLTLSDGIECDELLSTGLPFVYAAGDCCRWTNPLFGETARIEHWTIAAEQGAHAAANLLAEAAGDERTPYAPVPFFWSDQFDRRIQFLGRSTDVDEIVLVHDDPETGKFVALYRSGDRLRGALGLSMPRQLMSFRALLAGQVSWDEALEYAASI